MDASCGTQVVYTNQFTFPLLFFHIQCSQKVSFRPETGPEFPQNEKKNLADINRKKLICMFRGGNFLFLTTVFQKVILQKFLKNKRTVTSGIGV